MICGELLEVYFSAMCKTSTDTDYPGEGGKSWQAVSIAVTAIGILAPVKVAFL